MTSRHRPPRAALTLSVAKVIALGLLLVVLVSGFAAWSPLRAQHPTALRVELISEDLQQAITEHNCSITGFGDSASPRSALIRRHGVLRHVSFDRAWSVFTGQEPGELLAVCLGEVLVRERPVTSRA